jgi:hypothetical protein
MTIYPDDDLDNADWSKRIDDLNMARGFANVAELRDYIVSSTISP